MVSTELPESPATASSSKVKPSTQVQWGMYRYRLTTGNGKYFHIELLQDPNRVYGPNVPSCDIDFGHVHPWASHKLREGQDANLITDQDKGAKAFLAKACKEFAQELFPGED